MSIQVVTCVLPYFPGRTPEGIPVPTMADIFGPEPFLTSPTETGPDGPDGTPKQYLMEVSYFATEATARLCASMIGADAREINFSLENGSRYVAGQPNWWLVVPGGGLINAGTFARLFGNGYPLVSPAGVPDSPANIDIATQINVACAVAGYSINWQPSVSPAPAPQVAPTVMVGNPCGQGMLAFGSSVIPGVQGGKARKGSNLAPLVPVNVWNGMSYSDAENGNLMAFVYPSGFIQDVYSGFWIKVG